MKMTDKSPSDLTAEAQRIRDAGDPRPVSQIEAEMLAQDQAGQLRGDDHGRNDKASRGDSGDTPKPGRT
jgi:hypothetical protein